MRKNTPHKNRIHELATALERHSATIYEWERLGLDVNQPLDEIIRWRSARDRQKLSRKNRGNLDRGLARMIVERSGQAHTQQQIADYCGVGRAWISEVETRALRRLRVFCAEKGIKLEDFASALGSEFR